MSQDIQEMGKDENGLKRITVPVFLLAGFLVACGSSSAPASIAALPISMPETTVPSIVAPEPRTLTVFAAASLTGAFSEIGHNFEAANPGVTVALNYAGSQTLSTQLIQGAAADVFASANKAEMDMAVAANLVLQGAPKNILTNKLIVILPATNPGNVQTLQDLARPGLKLVLAAKTVPVGKYALQALDRMSKDPSFGTDFKTKVLANMVSEENDVKQIVAKVQLGEADAGIVYNSDPIAAPELKTIAIPDNLNVIATYPIAALTNARQPELASGFIAYVLSAGGQAVLKKWGFTSIVP
jgi:molybdate transport system substrate-binding protein